MIVFAFDNFIPREVESSLFQFHLFLQSMEISSFSWSDVGDYKVTIENDFGTSSQDVRVDMAGKSSTLYSRIQMFMQIDKLNKE